jgi:Fe2+ or Zn2+ uptake regulation protein
MNVLKRLKTDGYRLTKPRKEVLKTLTDKPQTVQEIYDVLKKGNIDIDIASVYRTIELFVTMGVVYVIDFGGDSKKYELVNRNHHHHHLVCNNCGNVEDISLNEHFIYKELKRKTSFIVDHHHLEFFGLCINCQ